MRDSLSRHCAPFRLRNCVAAVHNVIRVLPARCTLLSAMGCSLRLHAGPQAIRTAARRHQTPLLRSGAHIHSKPGYRRAVYFLTSSLVCRGTGQHPFRCVCRAKRLVTTGHCFSSALVLSPQVSRAILRLLPRINCGGGHWIHPPIPFLTRAQQTSRHGLHPAWAAA